MIFEVKENAPIDFASAAYHYQHAESSGARLKALKHILGMVKQLVQPHELQAIHKENMMELVTIRTLISMRAFQHIPEQGSISSIELARMIGVDERLLVRLLRMAASAGIVEQLVDSTFAHTEFSRAYAAKIGTSIAFQVFYDESFQPLTRLHQYLKEKLFQEPEELASSPAMWATGNEGKAYWDVMQADRERLAAFQIGMRASQKYLPSTGPYDFDTLAQGDDERPVLVDVGGGQGQTICEILRKHPSIPPERVILQDLPKVVEAAREEKIVPLGVEIMEYDYNDPQPVKGAKAYLFRRVFHSSSDRATTRLLKNVASSMAEDSVVLIADYIVPNPVPVDDIGGASASVAMMTVAGKERTIEDFRNVFDEAGLQMTGIFKPEDGDFGLVEARLKSSALSLHTPTPNASSADVSPVEEVSLGTLAWDVLDFGKGNVGEEVKIVDVEREA